MLRKYHVGKHTQLYKTASPWRPKSASSVSDKYPNSRTNRGQQDLKRNPLDEGKFPKDILKAAQLEQDFEGCTDYTGSKGVEDQREASSQIV